MAQRTLAESVASDPDDQYEKDRDANDSVEMQYVQQLLPTDSDDRLELKR